MLLQRTDLFQQNREGIRNPLGGLQKRCQQVFLPLVLLRLDHTPNRKRRKHTFSLFCYYFSLC